MTIIANKILKDNLNDRDRFLISLMSLWLFVDCLNGFFINTGIPIPISPIFKSSIILLIVCCQIRYKKLIDTAVFFFLYLFSYGIIVMFGDASFGQSVSLLIKPITTLLIFYYFVFLFRTYKTDLVVKSIIRIFKVNTLVFCSNILLGLVGIGYRSYEGENPMGFCGFFYSPNELSGVVAVIFPLILTYVKVKKTLMAYIATIMLLGIITFLLSTKAPLLSLLISVILISYFYGKRKEKRLVIMITAILFLTVFTYVQSIISSNIGIMQRLNYFIEKEGILFAITSGRLEYWREESVDFYNANIIHKIFGLGGNRTVEMDIFDILLNCGIIGLFFLLAIYKKMLFDPFKVKLNPFTKAVLVSNILLVFMSIISGHILFSSMAGLFIAMSNSLLLSMSSYTISDFKKA